MLCLLCAATDAADHPPVTDLRGDLDPHLQSGLERIVRDQRLSPYVEAERLALGLIDITDLDHPRMALLNPDLMVYAASLPKIAILLGAFVEIESGELVPDPELRQAMSRMIQVSDNAAATYVLDRIGRERLLETLTSQRLRLYHRDFNGGLWVGKDYARRGAYARDPLHGLSHGATVRQVARFFYLLERGELVSEPYRTEMKQILADPGIEHKFVAGLKARPDAKLYRKSGTWRQYHADAALIESGPYRYILVGLARHANAGDWLSRLAQPIHDLVVGAATGSSVHTE
jgi:beta-lactamase class A